MSEQCFNSYFVNIQTLLVNDSSPLLENMTNSILNETIHGTKNMKLMYLQFSVVSALTFIINESPSLNCLNKFKMFIKRKAHLKFLKKHVYLDGCLELIQSTCGSLE